MVSEEVSEEMLQNELYSMLKEPKGCTCLMLKTPLKLMRKSKKTPLFFLFLIMLNYLILLFMIFPKLNSTGWFTIDTLAVAVVFLFFAFCSFKDPGYLTKAEDVSFLTMLQ